MYEMSVPLGSGHNLPNTVCGYEIHFIGIIIIFCHGYILILWLMDVAEGDEPQDVISNKQFG